MKKSYRYVLKPQVEEDIKSMSVFGSSLRSRSQTSHGSRRGGQRQRIQRDFPQAAQTERSHARSQSQSMKSIQGGCRFNPKETNTVFFPNQIPEHKFKYKNDYLTRDLKKSTDQSELFQTIYGQDFSKNFIAVKPPKTFFKRKKQKQYRPASRDSTYSNRNSRFRGRRYSYDKVPEQDMYQNGIYYPTAYDPEAQYSQVDKPQYMHFGMLGQITPQIQYRAPHVLRKHRRRLQTARENSRKNKLRSKNKKKKQCKTPRAIQRPRLQFMPEMTPRSVKFDGDGDKNPQEESPKIKIKDKIMKQDQVIQNQQEQQQEQQSDGEYEPYIYDEIENNHQFDRQQNELNQMEEAIETKYGNLFKDNRKYFKVLKSREIKENPLVGQTHKNSPWSSMKMKFPSQKTSYQQQYPEKNKVHLRDQYRTDQVYAHKTKTFGPLENDTNYKNNFFKKQDIKIPSNPSTFWQRSKIDQKFHNSSHNQNEMLNWKIYGKEEYMREPYLPTGCAHDYPLRGETTNQREFQDKSKKVEKRTWKEEELNQQNTDPVIEEEKAQEKNIKQAKKVVEKTHHNHRKVKGLRYGQKLCKTFKNPPSTIKLTTQTNWFRDPQYKKSHKKIPLNKDTKTELFSRGKPDLKYRPVPSYRGQFKSLQMRTHNKDQFSFLKQKYQRERIKSQKSNRSSRKSHRSDKNKKKRKAIIKTARY